MLLSVLTQRWAFILGVRLNYNYVFNFPSIYYWTTGRLGWCIDVYWLGKEGGNIQYLQDHKIWFSFANYWNNQHRNNKQMIVVEAKVVHPCVPKIQRIFKMYKEKCVPYTDRLFHLLSSNWINRLYCCGPNTSFDTKISQIDLSHIFDVIGE